MTDLILAVDTTNEHGSLALSEGTRLIEEVTLHAPSGYSEILFGAIRSLLESHQTSIAGVDLFAAASGPGTFTGVRVGLACVKGLAEAMNKPVAAISNLEAVALFGRKGLRAVTLDARRGEVYAALYDADGRAVLPERVAFRDAFEAALPDGDIEFISYEGPLAAAIARIAARRLATGNVSDPAGVEANYIRRTDAELHLIAPSSSPPRT